MRAEDAGGIAFAVRYWARVVEQRAELAPFNAHGLRFEPQEGGRRYLVDCLK